MEGKEINSANKIEEEKRMHYCFTNGDKLFFILLYIYGWKISGWEICTFHVTFSQFSWGPGVNIIQKSTNLTKLTINVL